MDLKVDIINDAYQQLRISGLTVNPSSNEITAALNRLERMAAEWAARNICAKYNFEEEPGSNSPSGIARQDQHAFATNLAVRLIPDFNKQTPPSLQMQARQALSGISGRSMLDRLQQNPYPRRQPRGSGNTLTYNRWDRFYHTQGQAPTSCATKILFKGDIQDYSESYSSYLDELEDIDTYEITPQSGLILLESENNTPVINYRIQGEGSPENLSNQSLKIKISITTTTGRVTTRIVYFRIEDTRVQA